MTNYTAIIRTTASVTKILAAAAASDWKVNQLGHMTDDDAMRVAATVIEQLEFATIAEIAAALKNLQQVINTHGRTALLNLAS